jgi:ComF family protein
MMQFHKSCAEFTKKNFIHPVMDFIYSPMCFHCQHPVPTGNYLCGTCNKWLQRIPFESDLHKSLRHEVFSHAHLFRDVYSLYEFIPGGVLQTLLHDLKYQQKTRIGIDLGRRLGTSAKEFLGIDESWVLIPVPLYPARERERGYNQALFIAAGVHEVTGARVDTKSIIRIRKTRTQTKLTTPERKDNVASAFARGKSGSGTRERSVAIIDDVITTGATITEIARILPESSNIYALSLAHSPVHSQ